MTEIQTQCTLLEIPSQIWLDSVSNKSLLESSQIWLDSSQMWQESSQLLLESFQIWLDSDHFWLESSQIFWLDYSKLLFD